LAVIFTKYILQYFLYLKKGYNNSNVYIDNLSTKHMETAPSNISSTTTVQIDRLERAYTNGKFYKAIIIFLLIIIIAVSFFVYSLLTKSPLVPTEISSLLYEAVICKNCDLEEEVEDTNTLLKNSDWAFYQFPTYGFSVEIPDNYSFLPGFESEEYRYVWSIRNYSSEEDPEYSVFPNLKEIISVSYFPINTPNLYSEIDAVKGSTVHISFYENIDKLTIEEIESQFFKEINDQAQGGQFEITNYTKEFKLYQGKDAFTYTYDSVMFPNKGTILLTDEYIVQINKTFLFSEGEQLEMVNKVINGMRFK